MGTNWPKPGVLDHRRRLARGPTPPGGPARPV